MRVLGIDCGTEYTGFGVVELASSSRLHYLTCGAIKLSTRDPLPTRLSCIYTRLEQLIHEYQPDQVAIEDVFYALNAKSALKLGQVRGVAMLAAAVAGLEVAEYAPLSIKSAVVGYGRAEKQQVQHMVTRLLELTEPPAALRCVRRARHRHLPPAHLRHTAAPDGGTSLSRKYCLAIAKTYVQPEDLSANRRPRTQPDLPRLTSASSAAVLGAPCVAGFSAPTRESANASHSRKP